MTWWQALLTGGGPIALLTALVAILWERRKRKEDAPITSAQADTALKVDHVGMSDTLAARAMALAEAVQDQLEEVRADLRAEKARSQQLARRNFVLTKWVEDLHRNWDIIRQDPTPPALPPYEESTP